MKFLISVWLVTSSVASFASSCPEISIKELDCHTRNYDLLDQLSIENGIVTARIRMEAVNAEVTSAPEFVSIQGVAPLEHVFENGSRIKIICSGELGFKAELKRRDQSFIVQQFSVLRGIEPLPDFLYFLAITVLPSDRSGTGYEFARNWCRNE